MISGNGGTCANCEITGNRPVGTVETRYDCDDELCERPECVNADGGYCPVCRAGPEPNT